MARDHPRPRPPLLRPRPLAPPRHDHALRVRPGLARRRARQPRVRRMAPRRPALRIRLWFAERRSS